MRRRFLVIDQRQHICERRLSISRKSKYAQRYSRTHILVSKLILKVAFCNLTGQSKCSKKNYFYALYKRNFFVRSCFWVGSAVLCTQSSQYNIFHGHKSANYLFINLIINYRQANWKQSIKFDVVAETQKQTHMRLACALRQPYGFSSFYIFLTITILIT